MIYSSLCSIIEEFEDQKKEFFKERLESLYSSQQDKEYEVIKAKLQKMKRGTKLSYSKRKPRSEPIYLLTILKTLNSGKTGSI